MSKPDLFKTMISLYFLSLFFSANGNPNPRIYKNLENINIAKEIPANAMHKILVVSNRYFEPGDEYTYARYVHPKRQMFWFVISLTSDSSYITSYSSLEDAIQVFPKDRNFLIFVNGHGKTFGEVIGRGFEIGTRYQVNMIMFDWPTDYYALRKTARNARKVTENFAITIQNLEPVMAKDFPNSNVSLIFHSMGNHIARRLVKKEYTGYISENFFNNLILNAAAVKQKKHAEWVDQLNIQKRIYITSNKDDFPLKGATILRMAKQLGSEYKEPLSEKVNYLNFSNIADREHNIFLGRTIAEQASPYILNLYNVLFQGLKPVLQNNNNFAAGKYKIDFILL